MPRRLGWADAGEVDDADCDLPRRLKDPVNRALTASRLSLRTLCLFIEGPSTSTRPTPPDCWLRDGVRGQVVMVRPDSPLSPAAPARSYGTIMLHEFHTVGADQRPAEHRTVQGDPGRRGDAPRRRACVADLSSEIDGLYAVDIHLNAPCSPRPRQPDPDEQSKMTSSPDWLCSRGGKWRGFCL